MPGNAYKPDSWVSEGQAAANQAEAQKRAAAEAAKAAAAKAAADAEAEKQKALQAQEAARVAEEQRQREQSAKATADMQRQIEANRAQEAADRQLVQGDINVQRAKLAAQEAKGASGLMREQMEAADVAAQSQAKAESDTAIQQAIRAGRSSGMLPGQAALAALQAGGGYYQQALASGRSAASQAYAQAEAGLREQANRNVQNTLAAMGYTQAGGQTAAQQLLGLSQLGQQGGLGYAGLTQQAQLQREQMINDAKMLERQLTEQGKRDEANRVTQFINQLISGVATMGGALVASDERVKDDIRPTSFLDGLERVKSKSYRYKGSARPEAGLVAQDLEKTNMAPAVVEEGGVKMIDTGRLSTMNTSAISELNEKVKQLIADMGEIKKPEGGK